LSNIQRITQKSRGGGDETLGRYRQNDQSTENKNKLHCGGKDLTKKKNEKGGCSEPRVLNFKQNKRRDF